MLRLWKPSNPYFLILVACTLVGLPYHDRKFLQGECGFLQADWRFALCTAQLQGTITVIMCIIIVMRNLWWWGQVHDLCDLCFPWIHWRVESVPWEGNCGSPRCFGRMSRLSIRAASYWPIVSVLFWRSWRNSRCTWRWWLLSWWLGKGEHLRPTIIALVEVISLPLWPITWVSLTCAAGWLWTVCHVQWVLVIKLRSAWKWLLWSSVTIPLHQTILSSVVHKSYDFASDSLWTDIRGSWFVVMVLLQTP